MSNNRIRSARHGVAGAKTLPFCSSAHVHFLPVEGEGESLHTIMAMETMMRMRCLCCLKISGRMTGMART